MTTALTATLEITPELQSDLSAHNKALLFVQEAFPVIETGDDAQLAAAELSNLKGRIKALEARRAKFIEPAKLIIGEAETLFGVPIKALEDASAHVNGKLLEFREAERQRVERERREQQERERRDREEAARKAAAERARAEEAERQRREAARRQEEEAERQQAEADRLRRESFDKSKKERDAAEREARKREEDARRAREKQAAEEEAARQARERGEREAIRIQQDAEARTGQVVEDAPKVKGFSDRKNWKCELDTDKCADDSAAIRLIAAALGERPEYVSYLELNWTALHKQAKAVEHNFNIPGLVARNRPVGVSR